MQWKQQLPVLLITALERLTRSEMEEVVSEGVKHEQGMADDESFQNYKDGGKTLRGGGDKREYGSGQLTLQHRQNSKQTVFQFCWNTCSFWQRAHRQRHTLPLSKHVRQTRQTARKEQREAALSKKAVTLPLPWSSVKDARLCSHNMPTCTSAATTAAHHLGHLCV